MTQFPRAFDPDRIEGLETGDDPTPIDGATWYEPAESGDRLVYEFPEGTLAGAEYLTLDMLVDAPHSPKHSFVLSLHEAGEDGRTFTFDWGCLVQCGVRPRIPTEATNQNTWLYPREGGWLKPIAGGDRVDLERVDRMELRVRRLGPEPLRWCQTPIRATAEEPPRLTDPVLPEGELVDELGQSAIHDWEGKTGGVEEVVERLERQVAAADDHEFPADFSEWGGWTDREFEATGFFRLERTDEGGPDGDGRWWLVDPDGHPFWSAGLDCVRVYPEAAYEGLEEALAWLPDPDGEFADAHTAGESDGVATINYLAANFIRAFGEDWRDRWATYALGELRRLGFNTVGNWSRWRIASEAGVPYVRPLSLSFPETDDVYRDFPDVFADAFEEDAAGVAADLEETAGDPALVGYFLGNEPNWAFADEPPAAGMLYTTETCETRGELAAWLDERHGDQDLADAWGMDVALDDVREGAFEEPLTDAAMDDLEAFSTVMVERLFGTVSEACREVDPDHLNLGVRYAGTPPDWALDGLGSVDVFSINCYGDRVDPDYERIAERVGAPVLIGEWHFGSLEAPLGGVANCVVETERERGDAFRVYQEDAAATPWCVGTHYFTLYDKSALGRPDGENYNQGFVDTCNRPFPMAEDARETHERLYDLAVGDVEPYDDAPDYLHDLYL